MGEAIHLARLVMAVGFLALFASILYPSGGVPAFSGLSSGFPTFDNPFSQTHRQYTLGVANFTTDPDAGWGLGINAMFTIDSGETIGPPFPNIADCYTGTTTRTPRATYPWWNCLSQKDQYGSYYESIGGVLDFLTDVGLGTSPGVATDHLVSAFTVNIECTLAGPSEPASSLEFFFTVVGAGSDFTHSAMVDSGCIYGWSNLTFNTPDVIGSGVTTGDFENSILTIQHIPTDIMETASDLLISYVSVTVFYSPSRLCTGSAVDQANCYISQIIQFLLDVLSFVINLLIFIVDWVVFIGVFFLDLITILAWFYAIPGMPTVFQAIVDIIITGFIFMIAYSIAKLIRGSGPV